jgi:uncharacterized protein involved in type VI secretion and phage assembly
MHVDMKRQLAADRVARLRAEAHRARHERAWRARRATEAGQALARREWRVLVHALLAR